MLSAQQDIRPGDIVWVRGGIYRGKFEVKLVGKEDAPVIVRAYPAERATVIEGGMTAVSPRADYT